MLQPCNDNVCLFSVLDRVSLLTWVETEHVEQPLPLLHIVVVADVDLTLIPEGDDEPVLPARDLGDQLGHLSQVWREIVIVIVNISH